MAIRSSMLRHRVEILENRIERSESGATRSNWEVVAERWAAMLPQLGREFYAARQMNAETTQVVVFRGPLTLDPRWRIRAKGRWFEILSVIDVEERGIEIRALCKEGVLPR
jgi:SPP1 family predicted phage head-tail adaptor